MRTVLEPVGAKEITTVAASLPVHPGRAEVRTAVTRAVERSRSGAVRPPGVQAPGPALQAAAEVLGCVTEVLTGAAGGEDAELAQVCRGVLDVLTAMGSGEAAGAEGMPGGMLPRPGWATRSVAEDGGIVHEVVSPLRPAIVRLDVHGRDLVAAEVSMSVADVCINGRWLRTRPTVQIEGGSYPLQGARLLWQILDGFLACSDEEGPSTRT